MEHDLRTTLASMVERFGFEKVYGALREIAPSQAGVESSMKRGAPTHARNRGARSTPRPSAVEYVRALDLAKDKTHVIERAAKEFECGSFLPTLADLRSFFDAYGIDELKSKSRISGIPRIFKFLATMEPEDIAKILDSRLFSGPAELAPIADAIRSKSKQLMASEPSEQQSERAATTDAETTPSLTSTQAEQ